MNYEFKMNECEAEAAKKWTSEHVCAAVPIWKFWVKTIDARYRCLPSFTYSFTPAGIGDSVIVSCHCGAKRDVTDYGSW